MQAGLDCNQALALHHRGGHRVRLVVVLFQGPLPVAGCQTVCGCLGYSGRPTIVRGHCRYLRVQTDDASDMTAACHSVVFLELNSCREATVQLQGASRIVADGRAFAAVEREGTRTMQSASAARREPRRCMAERKQKGAPN